MYGKMKNVIRRRHLRIFTCPLKVLTAPQSHHSALYHSGYQRNILRMRKFHHCYVSSFQRFCAPQRTLSPSKMGPKGLTRYMFIRLHPFASVFSGFNIPLIVNAYNFKQKFTGALKHSFIKHILFSRANKLSVASSLFCNTSELYCCIAEQQKFFVNLQLGVVNSSIEMKIFSLTPFKAK